MSVQMYVRVCVCVCVCVRERVYKKEGKDGLRVCFTPSLLACNWWVFLAPA